MKRAFKSLLKSPGFTGTALATLALCLGANLTIFALVDAILLRPLPFPDASRLVTLVNSYPNAGYPHGDASIANYFDRRHSLPALASVSFISQGDAVIGDAGSPRRVPVAEVMPEFFATLGVSLALGRSFSENELSYGTDHVAVLTDEFWHEHFAGDPHVLGKTFLNDGVPVTVIGVLPAGFHFLSSGAQFFRPLSYEAYQRQPNNRHNNEGVMIARLAPDATLAEAQIQVDAFNVAQSADDPKRSLLPGWGYRTLVRSLHDDHVSTLRPMLLLLQAGALLLLLIGLVNLANLFLIRACGRARELVIRKALGAGTGHIIREIVTETMLLALGGGMLGLLLGDFGIDLARHLGASQLPLGAAISLDAGIATAGFLTTLATGIILALPLIWFNLHAKPNSGLQFEPRGGSASRSAGRLRNGFVVVQVSLAFVLLSGALLLGLSLERVLATPTGFRTERVLTGMITLPWNRYPGRTVQRAFSDRLLATIRSLPGVTQAAINNSMPFTGRVAGAPVSIEGRPAEAGETVRAQHRSGVTGDYFAAMGIPLLRGRFLDEADDQSPTTVCLIDQTMAERYWPGADPIGRRLAFDATFTEKEAATVVGVVGNVKQNELGENDGFGMAYFPFTKFQSNFFYIVVRTNLASSTIAPSIRKAILQLDPGLPIDDLRPLQTRIDDSLAARRSPVLLAGLFAGAALLLAIIGLYGTMAYAVAQRTREFGIRLALGAQRGAVLRMVLREGVRLAAIGLVAGVVTSLLAGRVLASLLYGVTAHDPLALAAVAALLALVALFACLLPARRATKVDPMIALRSE